MVAPWASRAPPAAAARSGSPSRWSAYPDGDDRGGGGPARQSEVDHGAARPEGPPGDRPRRRGRAARGAAHAPTRPSPAAAGHSAPGPRRLPAARRPQNARGRPLLESGRPHGPRDARRSREGARGRIRRLHHETDRRADLPRRGGAILVESCPTFSSLIEPFITVTWTRRPPAPRIPCSFLPMNLPS